MYEALAHDVTQSVGESLANLFGLVGGEEAENAVDALAGVDRVQGAQHQVSGLGGGERDFHCFAVADFAEQNHFRRLAQSRAQAGCEVRKILPHFPLAEGRLGGQVNKLDRILQRHDMDFRRLIDLVQNRGQGRCLAAAGAAGDEDDPEFLLHHFLENGRQA